MAAEETNFARSDASGSAQCQYTERSSRIHKDYRSEFRF